MCNYYLITMPEDFSVQHLLRVCEKNIARSVNPPPHNPLPPTFSIRKKQNSRWHSHLMWWLSHFQETRPI